MFDLAEAAARWQRVRDMMEIQDLDLLLAIDLSRDEILQGHQRWLTGYIPVGGPAAVLLRRDGGIELISERIGKPVTAHYKDQGFPISLVNGYSTALIAERIAQHGPKRLGMAEAETIPLALLADLRQRGSVPELIDASGSMQQLRLRKSAYEIEQVRQSCRIADTVCAHLPDIFKVGRRNFEVVADIDHLARLHGAESGFHLVLQLPFVGRPMKSVASNARIEAGARYLVEISPRCDGYYSQLTIPVTTLADDAVAQRAYDDIVSAKQAAQPRMRAGADLSKVAEFVHGFLAERGRTMASLSLGHFCGMALEEPRHQPSAPMLLEEGMTLIFHPVLSDPELHSLMRADTYLITDSGAERMNRYDGGMLMVR
jgi:Xaa-Pro aminopeptidase